jgi:hypothetical protein
MIAHIRTTHRDDDHLSDMSPFKPRPNIANATITTSRARGLFRVARRLLFSVLHYWRTEAFAGKPSPWSTTPHAHNGFPCTQQPRGPLRQDYSITSRCIATRRAKRQVLRVPASMPRAVVVVCLDDSSAASAAKKRFVPPQAALRPSSFCCASCKRTAVCGQGWDVSIDSRLV